MTKLDWDKAKSRPEREEPAIGPVWWWTVPKKGARCDDCSAWIQRNEPYVYSHISSVSYCQTCADRHGIVAGKSKRYRAWENQC